MRNRGEQRDEWDGGDRGGNGGGRRRGPTEGAPVEEKGGQLTQARCFQLLLLRVSSSSLSSPSPSSSPSS